MVISDLFLISNYVHLGGEEYMTLILMTAKPLVFSALLCQHRFPGKWCWKKKHPKKRRVEIEGKYQFKMLNYVYGETSSTQIPFVPIGMFSFSITLSTS